MFAQGESTFRHSRLVSELQDLSRSAQIEIPKEETPVFVPVVVNETVLPESKQPEEKDPYRSEWLPLYMEMNRIRAGLLLIEDEADRGEAALRILDLERKCMYWWDRADYYIRTGYKMPEDALSANRETVDLNKLYQRLTTVRTYISRTEKKLLAGENKMLEKKLATWKAEARQLKDKIELNTPIDE